MIAVDRFCQVWFLQSVCEGKNEDREKRTWRTKKKRLHHPADAGQEDKWQGRVLRQGFGHRHHRGSELGRPIVFAMAQNE